MFEESLVESTALIAQRNRWPAVASVGLQLMLAAALLSIPLVHPENIVHAPKLMLVAPMFKPPQPPTPPPQRVHVTEATTQTLAAPAPSASAEAHVPSFLHPLTNLDAAPDPGTPISMTGGSVTGIASFGEERNGTGPAISVARPAPAVTGPARISQGVSAGLLLEPIRPEYPQIAKVTHTEGTVIVHAVISREGKIESAQVIGGPAMLQATALEAVRRARYRPYQLNGVPTEVETTFSITFHMNN